MKQSFKVLKNTVGNLEWLYVPDVLYAEYENCKRCLQLIIPYKREWKEPEKYPLVLFIPGSAWYRQEMYNSLPAASALAKKGICCGHAAVSGIEAGAFSGAGRGCVECGPPAGIQSGRISYRYG